MTTTLTSFYDHPARREIRYDPAEYDCALDRAEGVITLTRKEGRQCFANGSGFAVEAP